MMSVPLHSDSARSVVSNADLQAGQQIFSLLENSKARADETLDQIPGVHAVIDLEGVIIKGNRDLAALLECEVEELLGRNLSELFDPEGWRLFSSQAFVESCTEHETEIEVRVTQSASGNHRTAYLWRVFPFSVMTGSSPRLLNVFGKDIGDYKNAQVRLTSLTKDLEVAQAIQSLLLPKDTVDVGRGIELASFYRPASTAGGDWWWHAQGPNGSTLVFLADVLGHGAGPAMLTSLIAGACHTVSAVEALRTGSVDSPVRTYFEIFHQSLMHFCQGKYWMTMTVAEILPHQDEVRIWNTGGPSVFYLSAQGHYKALMVPGAPIGAGELEISMTAHPFLSGDRILLYTDGLHHFDDPKGTTRGVAKLRKGFVNTHGLSIQDARAVLEKNFLEALGNGPQLDDAAFVVIDRRGS